ncbi:MAG: hypothetical protein KatS3mg082_1198 [Nitrospiraceae bacterium]|nr:MAG: hypothetical protein KatS3mg082_1198 [Nitrospiraceae bacterium]
MGTFTRTCRCTRKRSSDGKFSGRSCCSRPNTVARRLYSGRLTESSTISRWKSRGSLGLRFILWNVESGDPDPQLTREQILARLKTRVKHGSMIVFHANGKGEAHTRRRRRPSAGPVARTRADPVHRLGASRMREPRSAAEPVIRAFQPEDREPVVRFLSDCEPWKRLNYTAADWNRIFTPLPQGRDGYVIELNGAVAGGGVGPPEISHGGLSGVARRRPVGARSGLGSRVAGSPGTNRLRPHEKRLRLRFRLQRGRAAVLSEARLPGDRAPCRIS